MKQDEENESGTGPAHHIGTRKGEEMMGGEGKEPGRHDKGTSHANRPTGGSTARDSTGVSPDAEEPIDPASPHLPPA